MGEILRYNYENKPLVKPFSIDFSKQKPKISVIIPIYNVEKYIHEALESIVNQTLEDFEIICVNDCSTDKSFEIVKEYAKYDNRFVLLEFEQNQGQGVARNEAIKIARGEYIAFLDPDDWFEDGAFAILYEHAVKNASQVLQFNYTKYDENKEEYKEKNFAKRIRRIYGRDLKKTPYFSWNELKKNCLTTLETHAWNYFYDAKFIINHNIQFAPSAIGEDHLFTIGAYLLADRVDYINRSFYFYRNRQGSAVNSVNDKVFEIFDNIKLLEDFLTKHDLSKELLSEFREYKQKTLIWQYPNVPKNLQERYKIKCYEILTNKEYNTFLKGFKNNNCKLIEKVFSFGANK